MLGSLVMLLSFGNNLNIFSNAMTKEMNTYMDNEDYSQRYEKFYKDDSFREAYYNYHKQHHQEEQQQQHQIENELQHSIDQDHQQKNSITESLPQQSTPPPQGLSSVSQEQMHHQQIVKLKQLLEAVR